MTNLSGPELKLEFGDKSTATLSIPKPNNLQYIRFTPAGSEIYKSQLPLRSFANTFSQSTTPAFGVAMPPTQGTFTFPDKTSFAYNSTYSDIKFSAAPPPTSTSIFPPLEDTPKWDVFMLGTLCYVTLTQNNTYHVVVNLTNGNMTQQTFAYFDSRRPKKTVRKAGHDLSDVRKMTDDADFKINCNDGNSVPVHSLIMKTYWPFFRAMMEADSVEKKDMQLNLEFPSTWVEVLVSYLYGQPVEMDFEQATGVCVLGDMYQLPELAEMATEVVTTTPSGKLTLEEAISGWQNGHAARNEKVKTFLAKEIAQKKKDEAGFENLTTEEMKQLYFDTLKVSTIR